jgi:putative endonuclease
MFWYVYIAQAKTGRYYVGISTNPASRLERHNMKNGADFAIRQGPFKIVCISSAFPSKSEARRREIQLKKWTRAKKEKLIRGEWS